MNQKEKLSPNMDERWKKADEVYLLVEEKIKQQISFLIIGPSQCGKTTILFKALEKVENGRFISFDALYSEPFMGKVISNVEELKKRLEDPTNYQTIFIDELGKIAILPDADEIIDYLLSLKDSGVYISGSITMPKLIDKHPEAIQYLLDSGLFDEEINWPN
jgi:predicted AAA+ superfamily ATPase